MSLTCLLGLFLPFLSSFRPLLLERHFWVCVHASLFVLINLAEELAEVLLKLSVSQLQVTGRGIVLRVCIAGTGK